MRLFILLLVLLSASVLSVAQVREVRGTQAVSEGRRYMVAFPQVWAETSETPLNQSMVLQISSRVRTLVMVRTPAVIDDAPRIDKSFTTEPNVVYRVPISTAYMTSQSETQYGYGILVTSDQPISVSTMQQWNGNGEVARHLPIDAWGTEYFTMNFYQDRYGTPGSYKYRPSQILIVASEDSTLVTYTPKFATEGGAATSSVAKGISQTIRLERGETYLIKDKIDINLVREFSADMSGTHITSTKPIGVVSGHTKGAMMRYPDVLPPTGPFAAQAHFVRNNVHDVMFPTEMAGTKFITVPCMYTPTRVTGQDLIEFGIDNDRGDVIRVIAIEDGTTIKAMSTHGIEWINKWKINRGETRIEPAMDAAIYWESDKPILMGMYGKSYAKVLKTDFEKEGDATEGHPTVEAGMPMLQTISSLDRFVSYATFHAPEGMDNFLNITFRHAEASQIIVDGKPLNTAFGGSMPLLLGTEYAYVRTPIAAGDHTIESVNDSVKWMAWTYGSLDGLQQGRAYGTPVAVDLATGCNDTILVTDFANCGSIQGTVEIRSADPSCGELYNIVMVAGSNYQLVADPTTTPVNKTWVFSVNILDKKQDATATVRFTSRSGNYVERTYTYTADKVAWNPDVVNWGALPVNSPSTKTFTITNESNNSDLFVRWIKPKHLPDIFSISPPGGMTIPANGSQLISITATVLDTNAKIDTAIIELGCFTQLSAELRINAGSPTSVTDDEYTSNSVKLSPTPLILSQHQFVNVNSSQLFDRLCVYDVAGREVYRAIINSTVCQIPASAFAASGMYAVRLSNADGEAVVPLMCFD